MGIRSNQPEFLSISKLGFFNPRQNIVYQTAIADIPKEVIETVEKCYWLSRLDSLDFGGSTWK